MTIIPLLPAADTVFASDLVPIDQSASGINRTAKASLTQLLQALPTATSNVAGTVKVGSGLTITNGILSVTQASLTNPTINGSISMVDPNVSNYNVFVSGAPSNQKRSATSYLTDRVTYSFLDDTLSNTGTYFSITRTGLTPTIMDLTSTTIRLNGTVNVVGALQVNGSALTGSGGSALSANTPLSIANGVISVAVGTTSTSVAVGNHTHSIYEQNTNKGVSNGYASLDSTGKVPASQLPATSGTTITGLTVTSGSTYVMQTADRVVVLNKTSGSATAVTLPASPTLWVRYDIIDAKGDAATNNITVTPASGTIDGGASFTMNSNYDSFSFMASANNIWSIV